MRPLLVIFCLINCFILYGCGNESSLSDETKHIEVRNISTKRLIDQEPSNTAKDLLIEHEEVTGVKAANTVENLIVAVEIKHSERFQLKKIKKKLSQELKKHFKDHHVELTIDKKIFLELDKLEEKIASEKIKPGNLAKEIDRITKLSKEKT